MNGDELMTAFSKLDLDGDGFIKLDELVVRVSSENPIFNEENNGNILLQAKIKTF